ncbi:MAG: hypothetical protein K8R21_06685, partial [Leptospira sp.]|nr:hypothetical protein [Leptospira sp.]
EMSGNKPSIDFTGGSIKVKQGEGANTHLEIRSNNQVIDVKGGDVKLQQNQGKDFSLFVDKGSAVINQNGQKRLIEKDQQADFGKDNVSVKQVSLRPSAPADQNTIIAENGSTPVKFAWSANADFPSCVLQISKNRNFSTLEENISSRNNDANVSLGPGTYYWRISSSNAKTKQKEFSETRKLSIIKDSPPQLFSPSKGSTVAFVSVQPLINFGWNRIETSSGYTLQVANNQAMSSNLQTFETGTNSISLDKFGPGTYYWRVSTKPSLYGLSSRKSNVQSFSIIKRDGFEAPEPVTRHRSMTLSELSAGKAMLVWKNENTEINKFKVQVSKDNSFKSPLIADGSNQNFYTIRKSLEPGVYHWRVKGLSSGGKETDYSSPQTLKVSLKEEKIEDPKEAEKDKKDDEKKEKKEIKSTLSAISPVNTTVNIAVDRAIKFSWTKQDGAASYKFKLFQLNDSGKRLVFSKDITGHTFVFDDLSALDEGKFEWQLGANMKDDNVHIQDIRHSFNIVAKNRLKNAKSSDIKFISPNVIYKDKDK